MFGLLNLHKPLGWTSRETVDRVRRCVRPHKAGHAGTLDPLASGVLVVGVGPATRLVEFVQQMGKRYSATFLLGRSSPSDDLETPLVELANAPLPTRVQVESAARAFVGSVTQYPPRYSAVKIGGTRSYRLARRGRDFQLTPRQVQIAAVRVLRYDYPELDLDISCGSGTYIRSLGKDLAERLGTVAVMSSLVRTAIGEFSLADAALANRLDSEQVAELLQSPLKAVSHLPQLHLTRDETTALVQGQPVRRELCLDQSTKLVAAIAPTGELAALLEQKWPGLWFPARNFAHAL